MAWEVVTRLSTYNCSVISGYSDPSNIPMQATGDYLVLGNTPSALSGDGSARWDIDTNFYVTTQLGGATNNDGSLYLNNAIIGGWTGLAYKGSKADFVFLINEDIEEADAYFVVYLPQINTTRFGDRVMANKRHALYLAIKNATPPLYNWVSVPSVTGKNGTISLAQIASDSINDGEPVSDAAATAFSDLPAECNVGEIIDELLPYEESLVDVLVKYKVKGAVTGAFEYVKLVAKKGSIPKSVEDGDKVVDINPSKKSKLVTGLDEGSKYYFVIFVKDSADQTAKSNEMWIITGAIPIPTDLRPYVEKMNLTSWGNSDQLTLLAYSCLSGNSNTYTIDDLYSYYIQDGNFSGNANAYDFFILSDCSISISTGSSITVTYDISMAPTDLVTVSGRSMWGPYSYTGNYTGSQYGYIGSAFGDRTGVSILGATSEFTGNPTTSFNTLLDCMQYLAQHFRRVKSLFVDGTQWI